MGGRLIHGVGDQREALREPGSPDRQGPGQVRKAGRRRRRLSRARVRSPRSHAAPLGDPRRLLAKHAGRPRGEDDELEAARPAGGWGRLWCLLEDHMR
ncbi:MAG: hypothetical protein AB1726_06035, partial [Planctomycetota bacterium]